MPRALLMLLLCAALPGESLFDGKSLGGWRETRFATPGAVKVENGTILLEAGQPLTGITWTGEFPKTNYEISWEGQRVQGGDFFAALTFPVDDSFCTFVTGGWGGDIIGLSSIDGWDASENETRTYFQFEPRRWYAFRVRVTPGRIEAWIDGKQFQDLDYSGRNISLRFGEIERSAPLGIASYYTKAALRNIEYKKL